MTHLSFKRISRTVLAMVLGICVSISAPTSYANVLDLAAKNSSVKILGAMSSTDENVPDAGGKPSLVINPNEGRPFSQSTALAKPLHAGMKSKAVRELQIRLRHAKFLATFDADGAFGPQTRDSVVKFQRANKLKTTGMVDQATWDVLRQKSHDPTDAEYNNTDIGAWFVTPTQPVWMMDMQHRLKQAGVYHGDINGAFNDETKEAVRAWRKKNDLPESDVMDERTWTRLIARTRYPSYAQLFDTPPQSNASQELDPRCNQGRVICISKEQQRMSFVVNGSIKFTRQARFSAPEYESPEGDFKIWYMNRDTISRIFGERIPMPYAIFYDGNVAVHYSDDFANIGYDGGSHGCSQLDDYKTAKWLYEQVKVGDRVVVY